MIINLHLDKTKDPNDLDAFVESDRSRASRQKQLNAEVEGQIRADKRACRLDKYFSSRPPNGRLLDIFRDTLADFLNTNGETPKWLTYEHLEASFNRLQRAGILVVEVTKDSFGVKTIKSEVTKLALANRRHVRPAELDTLIQKLKEDIGESLQREYPPLVLGLGARGCRQVTVDRWRVSLYFGGAQRALGCWPFETAVRLQDILAFHFSSYRRPVYNINEAHAVGLLTKYPAIATFCAELEKIWLDAGILAKPGETPLDKAADWREAIETRLSAIESHLRITP